MILLRALVVDANEATRRQIYQALEASEIDWIDARDGIEALGFMSEHGVDLIVADMDGPRMGGLELAALVKRGAFGASHPPMIVYSNRLEAYPGLQRPELAVGLTILRTPFVDGHLPAAIETALAAA